ncbi:MAG TPA: hypothetical protein PK280_09300 [Planctomycetota bacterium]|nr:hypothetical protein [Planctomycetota bacterium]
MVDARSLIRRGRAFEFYARHLWRFHRLLARGHLRRRCERCSVSEAFSPLGPDGICGECHAPANAAVRPGQEPDGRPEALRAELDRLLREHQGKGPGLHDALVMLSGGKDSALLLLELRRRYPGLRLLALTIDNSFMSPIALENCRQVAEKVDVDLVTLKPARSLFEKSFRFACTGIEAGKGAFETVDRIDADLGFSLAKIYAATHRIPLLMSGLSWAQVERLFGVQTFEVPAGQAMAKVTATLGTDLAAIYAPEELDYWWDPGRFPRESWPRFIHPFYAWRIPEQEIRDTVVREGLIAPGNDSPLLTNNVLIPMMVLRDYLLLGYASFEPEFASQVRAGKADRIFWRNVFEMLEHSAKTGWLLGKEVDKLAKGIGLTRQAIGMKGPVNGSRRGPPRPRPSPARESQPARSAG